MRYSLSAQLLLLLGSSQLVLGSPGDQVVIAPSTSSAEADGVSAWAVESHITAALEKHADPVDALVSLQPEMAAKMAEARLLHVAGEAKAEWMTEGDKLRLRRKGKKFRDITDFQELYTESVDAKSGKASAFFSKSNN